MKCQASLVHNGFLEDPLVNHQNPCTVNRSVQDSISLCVMNPKLTQEDSLLNTEVHGHKLPISQKDSKHSSVQNCRRGMPRLEDVLVANEQCGQLPSIQGIQLLFHECQKQKSRKSTLHIQSLMGHHGLENEHAVGNHMVSLFVNCGALNLALQSLQRLAHRSEQSWTSLIQAYVKAGEWQHAVETFNDMQKDGVQPCRFTYVALLKCFSTFAPISRGHVFHSQIIREGLEEDTCIGNALVEMYGRYGMLADARKAFEQVPDQDVLSWNSLIVGYAEDRSIKGALTLLEQMQTEGISPDDGTFVYVLQACSRLGAIEKGQILHSQIIEKGFEKRVSIIESLVDMYSLCRVFADAHKMVDLLPAKVRHPWTTLMAAYAEDGLFDEVLECKDSMHLKGVSSNNTVFVLGLKACGSLNSLSSGQELHSEVVKLGFQECPIVATGLINMYIKCVSLEESRLVFDRLLVRDMVVWTAMISGFAEHGFAEEALSSLRQMQLDGVFPDAVTYVSALKACGNGVAIDIGREIHVEIVKEGLHTSSFVGSALMHMYAECGYLADVKDVFEEVSVQDLVLWNTLIDACINCGEYEEAMLCMEELKQRGLFLGLSTTICGLKACSYSKDLEKGKDLHSTLVKQGLEKDIFLSSTLLDMYCKCGSPLEAQKVFDGQTVRTVVTWSVLISGYAENGDDAGALKCLEQMEIEQVCPDAITIVCNLKACSSIRSITKFQEVHSYIVKVGLFLDTFLGSVLVDNYFKLGLVAEGQDVFDHLQPLDTISWTALISGFIDLGLPKKALDCSGQMISAGVSPNAVTFCSVLKASGLLRAAERVHETHTEIIKEALESDLHVSNTLINTYAKCALLEEAFEVFNELYYIRDSVSWSAIIMGCVDQGDTNKALELYAQMKDQGVTPSNQIVSSILRACGDIAALETGKRLHAQIMHLCGMEGMLATAVLDMYGKCGSIVDAQQLFDSMHNQDVVALNALLNGYARCGQAYLSFERIKAGHTDPDDTTYLSLLTICCHQGLIGEGQEFFYSLLKTNDVLLSGKHFDCMVDLLGRAGQLEEAAAMLEIMPFQPDFFAWMNILIACRRFSNLDLGSQAFDCAAKLDNLGPAAFVVLSDLFAVSELAEWTIGDWG